MRLTDLRCPTSPEEVSSWPLGRKAVLRVNSHTAVSSSGISLKFQQSSWMHVFSFGDLKSFNLSSCSMGYTPDI